MTTNSKPPYGAPCNGCGHCCREELCPLGVAVFAMIDGPCPALGEAKDGTAQCGLMTRPRAFAPVATARHGTGAMRLAAALLIAAGHGCDAALEGEAVDPATRTRMRLAASRIPAAAIERAARLWGMARAVA